MLPYDRLIIIRADVGNVCPERLAFSIGREYATRASPERHHERRHTQLCTALSDLSRYVWSRVGGVRWVCMLCPTQDQDTHLQTCTCVLSPSNKSASHWPHRLPNTHTLQGTHSAIQILNVGMRSMPFHNDVLAVLFNNQPVPWGQTSPLHPAVGRCNISRSV